MRYPATKIFFSLISGFVFGGIVLLTNDSVNEWTLARLRPNKESAFTAQSKDKSDSAKKTPTELESIKLEYKTLLTGYSYIGTYPIPDEERRYLFVDGSHLVNVLSDNGGFQKGTFKVSCDNKTVSVDLGIFDKFGSPKLAKYLDTSIVGSDSTRTTLLFNYACNMPNDSSNLTLDKAKQQYSKLLSGYSYFGTYQATSKVTDSYDRYLFIKTDSFVSVSSINDGYYIGSFSVDCHKRSQITNEDFFNADGTTDKRFSHIDIANSEMARSHLLFSAKCKG